MLNWSGEEKFQNVLYRSDSPEYKDYLDKKDRNVVNTGETYEENDIITDKFGSVYIYLGKRHLGFVKYYPSIQMYIGANGVRDSKIPSPSQVYEKNKEYIHSNYYYNRNNDFYDLGSLGLTYKHMFFDNAYNNFGYEFKTLADEISKGCFVGMDNRNESKKSDYHFYIKIDKNGNTSNDIEAKRSKIKSTSIITNMDVKSPINIDDKSTYINKEFTIISNEYIEHKPKHAVNTKPLYVSPYYSEIAFFKTKKEVRSFLKDCLKTFEDGDGFTHMNTNDFDSYVQYCQNNNIKEISKVVKNT